jgi:subtilisin family serine protease
MPLRVLDQNGEGELWRITAAIIWAANHGAEVANLSFGYPDDVRLLKDLFDCTDVGTTPTGTTFPEIGLNRLAVVAAAGNGGNTVPIFPAAEDLNGSIGVGASTRNDMLAEFSTYDRGWVEVTAPGEYIVSALPGNRYGMWTGTSMAAPIVSGLTALVRAKNPELTVPHDWLDIVKETSLDIRLGSVPPWGEVRLNRVDALCAVTNAQDCLNTAAPAKLTGFEHLQRK